jgi:uncharacterized zinc-type alcohol dehydrogenase-like protein
MLINAIGTYSASQPLESMAITRREPGPQDVQIAIAYCGVCHSDLHQARSEWAGTLYPCVPGHEIVGRVTAVGNAVSRYAVGDLVGVGCMVDSCQQCEECAEGLENYCDHMVLTYNGPTQDAPGTPWRLFTADRGQRTLRAADNPSRSAAGRRRAAAVRRDHDLLAAAPLARRAG